VSGKVVNRIPRLAKTVAGKGDQPPLDLRILRQVAAFLPVFAGRTPNQALLSLRQQFGRAHRLGALCR